MIESKLFSSRQLNVERTLLTRGNTRIIIDLFFHRDLHKWTCVQGSSARGNPFHAATSTPIRRSCNYEWLSNEGTFSIGCSVHEHCHPSGLQNKVLFGLPCHLPLRPFEVGVTWREVPFHTNISHSATKVTGLTQFAGRNIKVSM